MSIRSGTGICPSAWLCGGRYKQVNMAAVEMLCILLTDLASVRSPVAAVVRVPVQALGRSIPAACAVVH